MSLNGGYALRFAVVQTLSASERIERVNRGIVRSPDEPYIEDDVAYDSEAERNADPCTSRYCKWPKSADGNVYVAYTISNEFSPREVSVIERGLESFHDVSCLRFVKRYGQKDYLNIQSLDGCWSYVGRRGNGQNLSLKRSGCVYFDTVQHEVLHALGFQHEQKRSDRDQYIRVLLENVTPGKEHAFDKINTLNQETTYDYGSVMHYHKYAFSKNNQPTLVAIPDSSVEFGRATEMSQKDIIRLNRLYQRNLRNSPIVTLKVLCAGEEEVQQATLQDDLEKAVSCCDSWPYQVEALPVVVPMANRDAFVKNAVLYHTVVQRQSCLDQLIDGLSHYGVLSLLRENPSLRVLLDIPGEDKGLAADFVAGILKPSYSVLGSNRRAREELMVVKFREFLQCVENKELRDTYGDRTLTTL
ncbi:High choriolytic enzyme 1 [Larimichthys crocea]|uniref:Uncharacterized protein n=1 Tax=Larimichthys crocea TaxID=215358 RepID=A0ACD3QES2_LARCR|nr:High choriolytic enzyme 1 [Larimichthys crocea]